MVVVQEKEKEIGVRVRGANLATREGRMKRWNSQFSGRGFAAAALKT
jgi:hypothetical protein